MGSNKFCSGALLTGLEARTIGWFRYRQVQQSKNIAASIGIPLRTPCAMRTISSSPRENDGDVDGYSVREDRFMFTMFVDAVIDGGTIMVSDRAIFPPLVLYT